MTKEQIEYIRNNFIVDIISREDKDHIHAYVHNIDGSNDCSFNILTAPDVLCYYGDVGSFIFKRYGQGNMLYFFNAKEPNYGYWEEKCIAGKDTEYNAEKAERSFLELVAEDDGIDFDDNNSSVELYKKIKEAEEEEESTYNDLEEALDSLQDEYKFRNALDYLSARGIAYENFETETYTAYFDRCLWNLSIFSKKIIELVEE